MRPISLLLLFAVSAAAQSGAPPRKQIAAVSAFMTETVAYASARGTSSTVAMSVVPREIEVTLARGSSS